MNDTVFADGSIETELVSVLSIEEFPVVSEAEKSVLIASLKKAQAGIVAGHFTEFTESGLRKFCLESLTAARVRNVNGL